MRASTSKRRLPKSGGDAKKMQSEAKSKHYVPLQTIEHAWAGISGMPHSVGIEGHLRPEALNLEA